MTCTCRVQEARMAALTQAGHAYQHLLPLPDLPREHIPSNWKRSLDGVFLLSGAVLLSNQDKSWSPSLQFVGT